MDNMRDTGRFWKIKEGPFGVASFVQRSTLEATNILKFKIS